MNDETILNTVTSYINKGVRKSLICFDLKEVQRGWPDKQVERGLRMAAMSPVQADHPRICRPG